MANHKSVWWQDRLFLAELFAVVNLGFLALDISVAHAVNQFAHWQEWLPLGFSLLAPVALAPGLLAMRQNAERFQRGRAGYWVAGLSILMGIAGMMYHLDSHFFTEFSVKSLVYTAPFVAPLAYTGLGLLLLLNRMIAGDSEVWARWLVFLALAGFVGNFILALADHAQNGFFFATEWIPVISSALAVGFLIVLSIAAQQRSFQKWCIGILVMQIGVGLLGFALHIATVFGSAESGWWSALVYGAPAFAPLLFPNLALLALLGLWSLWSEGQEKTAAVKSGLG